MPDFSNTCLFFGTFNPVHNGHLLMAETVADAFGFARILWIPTGNPPHRSQDLAPALDRYNMVRLATAANPRFAVSDVEVRREGPCYTVETLDYLFPQGWPSPGGEGLPVILGADALADLGSWRAAERLIAGCRFHQAPRPDYAPVTAVVLDGVAHPLEMRMIPMPPVGFSSTWVRQQVRAGRSLRYAVPDAVRRYVVENGLYL